MFSKFNLSISDFFYNSVLNKHLENGKCIYEVHEVISKKKLKEFIYENGHIDGIALQSDWFQIENVDVFISHSHQDINKVKAFAGWLYDEFGLTAFIDSCVWGYCDDLLKQIDDAYCKKSDGITYNYELRNYSTSHVHMMLSTALTEMIDNTECVFFYNTPKSVSLVDDLNAIKCQKKEVTLSPWIYHELFMTSLVRTRRPQRIIKTIEEINHRAFESSNIYVEYDIEKYLKEMIKITSDDLVLWNKMYKNNKSNIQYTQNVVECESNHPLDVLYMYMKIKAD